MREIVLASASPRRRDLLLQAGIPFRIRPSSIDEKKIKVFGTPEERAVKLALLKARDVAENIDEGLIVGADTIVVVGGEIFGKPIDDSDAHRMLSRLSGRGHIVITGIAVVDAGNGFQKTDYEKTEVYFSKLTPEQINAYIKTGEPRGKAGAYAVQGIGALFIERIAGCYTNVVGLPLTKLRKVLEEFGVKILLEGSYDGFAIQAQNKGSSGI